MVEEIGHPCKAEDFRIKTSLEQQLLIRLMTGQTKAVGAMQAALKVKGLLKPFEKDYKTATCYFSNLRLLAEVKVVRRVRCNGQYHEQKA